MENIVTRNDFKMKNSITSFILIVLIGSAFLIAGFSSNADGKSLEKNNFSMNSQTDFYSNDAGKHNSEFWSKFRESVMPDEKNTSSDYAGNDNPESKPTKPSNTSK